MTKTKAGTIFHDTDCLGAIKITLNCQESFA